VEKRLRLYDQFQAFDPLRKGFCHPGQVKTVFSIMSLDRELAPEDLKALQDRYTRLDGMFCYVDFCNVIDEAFTKKGLDKDPMLTITMPDASATAPAWRNIQKYSVESVQKVFDLEEKIRSQAKIRRCHMRSSFHDMDRTRRGHVSKSQFFRCMGMLGFDLRPQDIEILCTVYCDMGNLTEFNYHEFCLSCDLRSDFDRPQTTAAMPRQDMNNVAGSKYFDSYGMVHRHLPSPRFQLSSPGRLREDFSFPDVLTLA